MDFREAVFEVLNKNAGVVASNRGQKAVRLANEKRGRKLLWRALENKVKDHYEEKTGQKAVNMDWGSLLGWLTDNLPTILKLLAALFA